MKYISKNNIIPVKRNRISRLVLAKAGVDGFKTGIFVKFDQICKQIN